MDKIQADGDGAVAQAPMVAALSAHWHAHPDEILADEWDALLGEAGGSPFMRHALFKAMVDSGSAAPATGWHPRMLVLRDAQGRVVAGCPAFAKDHSYGEYVFDWAWADAHDRALASQGHSYFPKLLSAVPFSPVPGPRLLVHPGLSAPDQAVARSRLLDELVGLCRQQGWSSTHVLFLPEADARLAESKGWLLRHGVQFHWRNQNPVRDGLPFGSFEDFLGSLHRDKRKKIQQERRKVRDAGVTFETKVGPAITEEDWDFFYRCYTQTYREHGQQPYLSRAFWRSVAQSLPNCWTLFVATQGGEPIAASLLAVDPVAKVAYGRYWGATTHVSCLHFEACYYQGLNWCIEQGMHRFEGGAQGEHKLARGLLPASTWSAHFLRHPGLRQALSDFLGREGQGIDHYLSELDDRKPFKPPEPASSDSETLG
jgi:predicted N-acyltransferase